MSNLASGPLFTYEGLTGSSTLDYVLVPAALKGYISECGVSLDNPLNTSDHNPVFIRCDVQTSSNLCIEDKNRRILRWVKVGADIIKDGYTKCVTECIGQFLQECEVKNLVLVP